MSEPNGASGKTPTFRAMPDRPFSSMPESVHPGDDYAEITAILAGSDRLPAHEFIDGRCVAMLHSLPAGTAWAFHAALFECIAPPSYPCEDRPVIVLRWPDGTAPTRYCDQFDGITCSPAGCEYGCASEPQVDLDGRPIERGPRWVWDSTMDRIIDRHGNEVASGHYLRGLLAGMDRLGRGGTRPASGERPDTDRLYLRRANQALHAAQVRWEATPDDPYISHLIRTAGNYVCAIHNGTEFQPIEFDGDTYDAWWAARDANAVPSPTVPQPVDGHAATLRRIASATSPGTDAHRALLAGAAALAAADRRADQ